MIDHSDPSDAVIQSSDGLAAVFADMLAHLYKHASQQREPFRPDLRVDHVLGVLFTATGQLHALSGHSTGPIARKMLGDGRASRSVTVEPK